MKAAPKSLKAGTKVVKPKPKAAPKTKRGGLTGRDGALGAAVVAGAAGLQSRTKPEAAKAAGPVTLPTPKPKRRGTPPLGGPSDGRKKGPSRGRPPLGGPSKKPGRPPIGGVSDGKKKGPSKGRPPIGGVSDKRPKAITAGKNTGFGPKGNIFPKNAADRERLMKLYGGTGSAAAKAAAAGKQGTLAKKGTK